MTNVSIINMKWSALYIWSRQVVGLKVLAHIFQFSL